MRSPWTEGWQGRLRTKVQELGFRNVEDYVVDRHGRSFRELAKELGPNIAHMQIEQLLLSECKQAGRLLEGAAECLARIVVEHFPRGWETGVRIDYKKAGVVADWISDMLFRADQSELNEHHLRAIAMALKDSVRPPKGWLPKNGQDPLIQRAFKIGLGQDEG